MENQTPAFVGPKLVELIELLKKRGGQGKEGKMNGGVFAKSIGLDPSQFSKVKNGDLGITLKQIMDISSIYGVRVGWLLGNELPVFEDEKVQPDEASGELHNKLKKEIDIMKVSLDRLSKVVQDIHQAGKEGRYFQVLPLGKNGHNSKPDKDKQTDSVHEKGK